MVNHITENWTLLNARQAKMPIAFHKAYPDAAFTVVNQENYLDTITRKH